MAGTDPAAVAASVVALLREGRFAEVERRFAARLRAVASAETLGVSWAGEVAGIGAVTAVGAPAGEPAADGLVRVRVPVTGERGGLTVIMSVDDDGLMHGLRLAPAAPASWAPPPYADPERFTEEETVIGAGPHAVPGALTLPRGPGPWPGAVLLSGGGPFDRDATSGANKPLKDLAWGLASRGIAVARFDKVTFAHPDVAAGPGFTMAEEYVPHATAAVRLLQARPEVDPARVHVAGHSMGGNAAVRVAAAEESVAGVVLLAADAQPLDQAAVRVARHIAAVAPGPSAEAAVELIARQAARAGAPDLADAAPASELPFGWPGSYWRDLRYDRVAAAAALGRPLLIVQGGRDYQVTVADDLSRWRAGLAHRPGVTIRVHEADDHLFFPGDGPSTPAGYEPPQHVDPGVVDGIADWLIETGPVSRPGHGR